jgi:uncharacterized protein (TIGR02058 family)
MAIEFTSRKIADALARNIRPYRAGPNPNRALSSWSSGSDKSSRPAWSEEWKRLGLGAELMDSPSFPKNLFFVQMGFGVDQHGDNTATKAAIRAVRNAIEFNSIPGVISHLPGGRSEMLIHVKLGIPPTTNDSSKPLSIDIMEVAKVFPYGKLLHFEICVGGLSFHTGRVVEELGDENDEGICVAACISLGYGDDADDNDDDGDDAKDQSKNHRTYNTKDGF